MTTKTPSIIGQDQFELSNEMAMQLDDLFSDVDEERDLSVGEKEGRAAKGASCTKDTTCDQAQVALKIMATLSLLRPVKYGNLYLFEANLYLYLVRQHLMGETMVVEEAAEVLGIGEEQVTRFLEHVGSRGPHDRDGYLVPKKDGKRRADGDESIMTFEPFEFITKSKVKKIRHLASLTDFGNKLATETCSFSLFGESN